MVAPLSASGIASQRDRRHGQHRDMRRFRAAHVCANAAFRTCFHLTTHKVARQESYAHELDVQRAAIRTVIRHLSTRIATSRQRRKNARPNARQIPQSVGIPCSSSRTCFGNGRNSGCTPQPLPARRRPTGGARSRSAVFELAIETLNRQRETHGRRPTRRASSSSSRPPRQPRRKSPEEQRRMAEELWRKLFDSSRPSRTRSSRNSRSGPRSRSSSPRALPRRRPHARPPCPAGSRGRRRHHVAAVALTALAGALAPGRSTGWGGLAAVAFLCESRELQRRWLCDLPERSTATCERPSSLELMRVRPVPPVAGLARALSHTQTGDSPMATALSLPSDASFPASACSASGPSSPAARAASAGPAP